MDHGKEYWFKQSYEQQKKEISIELTRLIEFWGKNPRNVKLFMNRCIKYTRFSIEDSKNAEHIEALSAILELEIKYKDDYNNLELEEKIRDFFDDSKTIKKNLNSPLDAIFDAIEKNTPQSRMSIIQYDAGDLQVSSYTGTFEEIFSSIEKPTSFYYRVATLKQNTIRDRVKAEHFGVKTSCVGGMNFEIDEAIHRYLNHQVKKYEKGEEENFFYTLCHVEWYSTLLAELKKLTSTRLKEQLDVVLKTYPGLIPVDDLNLYRKRSGIYILVLDKYNTCYVGQAVDLTGRIMGHWSKSNYFTGTGIDLFKPFDTTRIYVYPCEPEKLSMLEYKILDMFEPRYSLNVLTGGSYDFHMENDIPLVRDDGTDDVMDEMQKILCSAMALEKKFIVGD